MPTTHVTSLELSRRLQELGVPQKSLFFHRYSSDGSTSETELHHSEGKFKRHEDNEYASCTSAYLASELGDIIYKNHKLMVCPNWEDRGVYRMQYDLQWWCEGKTLADVYAKMLIYLIEHHLISVEELGK